MQVNNLICFLAVISLSLGSCKSADPDFSEGHIALEPGMSMSYRLCGQGDTTLLFIHGWGIDKTYWKPQLDAFCPQYRVVTIDLPGFGLSGKNRTEWTFDQYAEDVKKGIDHLGLKKVILIGHSMSGDLILKVATTYPDNIIGLIGIDNLHQPGAPMDSIQVVQSESFFGMMLQDFDSTVIKNMKAGLFQPSTPDSVVRRVMNDVFAADSVIAVKVLMGMTKMAQAEQAMMQQLQVPLCLVNSDVYPTDLESLNKYCAKGVKLYTVKGSGHYPMIEKTEEFNKALQRAIWIQ